MSGDGDSGGGEQVRDAREPEEAKGAPAPQESQRSQEPQAVGEPTTPVTQEEADEALAAARDAVARAEATLHDQILAPTSGEDIEDEDHLDRKDTRGAWPNWSGKSGKE